jgi:tRNA A-37 threonylcarbamoyl transferase component Bud32
MEGHAIGQYRVTGILGAGGMGIVYAARHTLLDRPAAIKVLQPKYSSEQGVVQRLFNEARAVTLIRNPGIVEVYDFGWTPEGAAFIVMELLEGETLRARLKRRPLGWSTALALMRQVAGALGAAHGKRIIHRDLKPDNIFLVPDAEVPGGERIKLLDFGIAKLLDAVQAGQKTRTGTVMGTPPYMAPEQCRGIAVDARADLYALGCILFEMCARRPPFVAEGDGDVIAALIHQRPPALASLVSGVPRELEALVQRMLAKAPVDRVQTAEDLVRYLDAVRSAVGKLNGSGPVPTISPTEPANGLAATAPVGGGATATAPAAPAAPAALAALVADVAATQRASELAAPTIVDSKTAPTLAARGVRFRAPSQAARPAAARTETELPARMVTVTQHDAGPDLRDAEATKLSARMVPITQHDADLDLRDADATKLPARMVPITRHDADLDLRDVEETKLPALMAPITHVDQPRDETPQSAAAPTSTSARSRSRRIAIVGVATGALALLIAISASTLFTGRDDAAAAVAPAPTETAQLPAQAAAPASTPPALPVRPAGPSAEATQSPPQTAGSSHTETARQAPAPAATPQEPPAPAATSQGLPASAATPQPSGSTKPPVVPTAPAAPAASAAPAAMVTPGAPAPSPSKGRGQGSAAAQASQQPVVTVQLTIDSTPRGAFVLLEGEPIGQTPWVGKVRRSDAHTSFVLVLSGYQRQVLLIRPNKSNAYNAKLEPVTSAPPAPAP